MTIKAAAAYLSLSRTSIRHLIDRDDHQVVRLLADAPRIKRGDLDAPVEARTAPEEAPKAARGGRHGAARP